MVRIVFGSGLDRSGTREVPALTLGEALRRVEEPFDEVRVFVDGVDARRLEGEDTPVGNEDRVLLTRW